MYRIYAMFYKAKTTTVVVIKAEFATKKKVVYIDIKIDFLFKSYAKIRILVTMDSHT